MARKPSLSPREIDAIIDATGALGSGVTGTKPVTGGSYGGAGTGGSGFGGLVDAVKSAGTTALNVISLPQAAAFTTIGKVMGRPISWKNLGGYFYEPYKGSSSTLGVKNKWASLGLDIAADPTWLLALVPGAGQGYAAARIAAQGSRFSKGRKAFIGSKAARKFGMRGAQGLVRSEDLGKDFAKLFVGKADDAGRLTPETSLEALSKLKEAQSSALHAADEGWWPALRLGTRNNNLEIALPLRKPLSVGKAWRVRGTKLQLSKLQQSSFRILNAGENMAKLDESAVGHIFKTLGESPDEAKAGRALVGLALIARGKSDGTAKALITDLKRSGVWAAEHDEVYRASVEELKRSSKLAGKLTAADEAEVIADAAREIARRLDDLKETTSSDAIRAKRADAVERQTARVISAEMRYKDARLLGNEEEIIKAKTAYDKAQARLGTLESRLKPFLQAEEFARARSPENIARVREELATVEREFKRYKSESPFAIQARDRLAKKRAALRHELARLTAPAKPPKVPGGLKPGQIDATANEFMGELHNKLRSLGIKGGLRDITSHPELIEKFGSGMGTGTALSKNLQELSEALAKLDYVRPMKLSPSEGSAGRVREALKEAGLKGMSTPPSREGSQLADDVGQTFAKANPFEDMGAKRFRESLDEYGVPAELADEITKFFKEEFAFKKDPFEAPLWQNGIQHNIRVPLAPELDAMTIVGDAARGSWDRAVRNTVESMIRENGLHQPEVVKAMGEDLEAVVRNTSIDDVIRADVEQIFREHGFGYDDVSWLRAGENLTGGRTNLGKIIGWTKVWFTIMVPSHFFTNAWGGFTNGLINGNWGHLKGLRASIPNQRMNPWWVLGRQGGDIDPAYWAKTREIGGNTYSNADLLVMANMSGLGLGHGQTRQEIELMIHLLDSKGGNPLKRYARYMQKANITRENADRIMHWATRIKAGEDPLTAGANTIRAYFDYNALTQFEKVWLRNLLFFYTWIRKNTAYQATSILQRPGMYQAMWDMEQARRAQADPNEPDWIGKTFGVWFPGLAGPIGFSSPMQDIFKLDMDRESLRRNYLASVNPFIQVPIESLLNRDTFTGADIDRIEYADQKVPSILGRIPGLGGLTRQHAGAPLEPGADPMIVNLYNTFRGPFGGTLDNVTRARREVNTAYDILNRTFGINYHEPEPQKWLRGEYYRRIREKADKTAAYNLAN